MTEQKTKRMLTYLGFQDIEKLDIQIKSLKYESAEIKVVNEQSNLVLLIEVYRFPNQVTQWYIDIPALPNPYQMHKIIPTGNINNPTIDQYLMTQSKYLRIFDRLYQNASYTYPKIQITMDIVDTLDPNEIPNNEFSLLDLEFVAKVRHPQIKKSSISVLIEKKTKNRLLESGLINIEHSNDITEKTLEEVLLLCDMITI